MGDAVKPGSGTAPDPSALYPGEGTPGGGYGVGTSGSPTERPAPNLNLPAVLSAVVEESADSLTVIDEAREVVYRNAAAHRLLTQLGHPPEPGSLEKVYPPWAAERVEEAIRQARVNGPWRVETALLDTAGRELPIAQTIMCHQAGGHEYVSILSRDVSELRFTHALLCAERDILQLIASGQAPLEEILHTLCQHMDKLSDGGRHSVLLVNETHERLTHPIGPGLSARQLEAADGLRISPYAGSCGAAAYLGRQVVIEDVNGDSRWARGADRLVMEEGFRACTSTPIADGQGAILGTFAVYFPTTRGPTVREQEFIRSATYLAAVAIQQRRRQAEREFLATHDALTRLPNRVLFRDRVDHALVRAEREGEYAGILFVDLDAFKRVNDEQGHDAGDALIREVAQQLRKGVRAIDTVARLGGDEFVVLLARLRRPEDAARVAEKLMQRFSRPLSTGFGNFQLRVSVGIATYPAHGEDTDALLRRADLAMYRAKGCEGSHYTWAERDGADPSDAPPITRLE